MKNENEEDEDFFFIFFNIVLCFLNNIHCYDFWDRLKLSIQYYKNRANNIRNKYVYDIVGHLLIKYSLKLKASNGKLLITKKNNRFGIRINDVVVQYYVQVNRCE